MKTQKEEKEILLNIMYNGGYLQSENQNIGHEVINLFQSDNGNNYIYVLPYGNMAAKHNGKIETILLVKRHNASILEILAKAEGLEQIINISKDRPSCEKDIHQKQIQYIDDNNIRYGGKLLYEIMKENEGVETGFYVTFKADKIIRPKERIFITNIKENKRCYYLKLPAFAKQSPKMYISNIQNSDAYKALNKIINDKTLWNRNKDKKQVSTKPQKTSDHNFIDIIRKDYDELTYSNLFQYIFTANKELFKDFSKNVLGIKFNDNYTVERERANIDLLIYDNKSVVVIENKIKSNINGVFYDGENIEKTQLDKYHEYVEDNFTQNSKKAYFVFTPNYNIISLNKYDKNKLYKLIKYSEIYEFFEQYRKNHSKECKEIPYFEEFLYALHKHTLDTDNRNDIEAELRFIKAILSVKN